MYIAYMRLFFQQQHFNCNYNIFIIIIAVNNDKTIHSMFCLTSVAYATLQTFFAHVLSIVIASIIVLISLISS